MFTSIAAKGRDVGISAEFSADFCRALVLSAIFNIISSFTANFVLKSINYPLFLF